jgi:hypothetical protein
LLNNGLIHTRADDSIKESAHHWTLASLARAIEIPL